MSKRRTHEEFLREVYDMYGDEYEVLEKYTKARTKIKILHKTDNPHVFEQRPCNLLGGYKCNICCCSHKPTIEDVIVYVSKHEPEYKLLSEVYIQAHEKLDFECSNGHRFSMKWNNFKNCGDRCRECSIIAQAKKITKDHDVFVKEVFNLTKGQDIVIGKYVKSRNKIEMFCTSCNLTYHMTPNSFLRGSRCPTCSETKGEKKIREYLESNNYRFDSQYSFDDLVASSGRKLRFDFVVFDNNKRIRLLIEYDGEQHFKPIKYFGGKRGLNRTVYNDNHKKVYCKGNNIDLLRIPYYDFQNIEDILENHLTTFTNKQE